MKAVADTLGVARSNLVAQLKGPGRRRGPYQCEGDDAFLTEIRAVTDARPTYGYRRVAALLNRARRAIGEAPVNRKRVLRLMRRASLTLQPSTARRVIRAHEGKVVAPTSNQRWASDGLAIPCWNGETVHVAFAIDTHDREVMAWIATTGGISGEMVRNLMLAYVEQRFAALRAPHPVQWLADNGSAYAAHDMRDFAVTLNLVACFTPVRSPESNGVSEAFVKTLKCNYAASIPGPMLPLSSSISQLGSKTATRSTPTKACECAHPVSSSAPSLNQPRVRFNGGNSRRSVPRRRRFAAIARYVFNSRYQSILSYLERSDRVREAALAVKFALADHKASSHVLT